MDILHWTKNASQFAIRNFMILPITASGYKVQDMHLR